MLLIHYGLRRGEVLGLRWCDIDFEQQELHVRQQVQRCNSGITVGPVKTSAGNRSLPLVPSVAKLLQSHLDLSTTTDTSLIFQTASGHPIEPNNLVRTFHRLRTEMGLPRISVHYLRHTTATLLKQLGVPARDAQLILGHAHISTTQQLYQHGDLAGQREALDQLSRALADAET